MDDQRFDRISRVIASSTSRREALKGIAAAIGGGALVSIFGVRAERAAAQGNVQPGGTCETGEECTTGLCSEGGVCYCEDPSRPLIGCSCDPATEGSCDDNTLVCCATEGGGVCTSSSVGCNPTGECTSDPGGSCTTDDDCCEGVCSEQGVCYCSDPARPWIGCACNLGTEAPCGGTTAVCCPTTGSEPGGVGVCTSDSVGCQVDECTSFAGGACETNADCCEGSCSDKGVCYCLDPAEPLRGCACHTGTEDPCGDKSLVCCAVDDKLGGDGVCTPEKLGCEPTGACAEKGDGCKHHDDCCGYLICNDKWVCEKPHSAPPDKPKPAGGSETVTALPSTGSSPQASEPTPWIGAAALAGAAAIAASRLRKPQESGQD